MTPDQLDALASLIAAKVLAELQATQASKAAKNADRHLTPREYAAKARIQESKVFDAIRSGQLIALPSALGTSNVRRWKIPQWAIQQFEEQKYREELAIINPPKSERTRRGRNRAPRIFS